MLRLRAVALAALVAVPTAAVTTTAADLTTADPAGAACAAPSSRSLSGTIEGEDGRFVNVLVGIALHDRSGRTIGMDGCPISGYAAYPRLNRTLPAGGATGGSGLTKSWRVDRLPANAVDTWIEAYPKGPDHKTNQERYGQSMRRALPLPSSGIPLRLPLNCGLSGNGVNGDSGSIRGFAYVDGRKVRADRVRAWSEAPDTHRRILGWNMGTASSDGSWVVPNLEPGQEYSVWVTAGTRTVRVLHVPVGPCSATRVNAVIGTPPTNALQPWSTRPVKVDGSYRPVTGDFDGDSRSDIFWFGPGSGADRLWWGTASRGSFTSQAAPSVSGVYVPFTGDFDGDGRGDVFWYGPGQSPDALWFGRADRGFDRVAVSAGAVFVRPLVGDFDGDGRSDVFWYGPQANADSVWWGKPDRTFDRTSISVGGSYRPAVGDFNGDGRGEVLWYAPGAGVDARWSGRADRTFAKSGLSLGGDFEPIVLDVDETGRDDVLWYAPGIIEDQLWLGRTDGRWAPALVDVGGSFTPLAGDFDGDGAGDVVWFSPSGGDIGWYANSAWYTT